MCSCWSGSGIFWCFQRKRRSHLEYRSWSGFTQYSTPAGFLSLRTVKFAFPEVDKGTMREFSQNSSRKGCKGRIRHSGHPGITGGKTTAMQQFLLLPLFPGCPCAGCNSPQNGARVQSLPFPAGQDWKCANCTGTKSLKPALKMFGYRPF